MRKEESLYVYTHTTYMMLASIKEEYGVDDETAQVLATLGESLVASVVKEASRVDPQLSSALVLPPNIVTSTDICRTLRPYVFPPSSKKVWVLPACGDGSCLLTTLRINLDVIASTSESLRVLEGATARGLPELSGALHSPNHRDNHRIRRACVAWYTSPPSNLDLPLEGSVDYEVKEGDATVVKSRPMTRGDFIVMQMSESVRGDIDMSPESCDKRNAMALAYMAHQGEDRTWGSLPIIMAFVNILTVPRGIRVYQVIGGRLQSLCQDIVPHGATKLPSPEEDDLLSVDPVSDSMDIASDDVTPWESPKLDEDVLPEDEDVLTEDDTDDEEDDTDDQPEQMFFRLLFHAGGHYDALVTDTQKRLICHAFPSVSHEFKAL